MRRLLLALMLCATLPLGSCLSGSIYTHTITPLPSDLRSTNGGETTATSDTKDFNYSYVRIVWGSSGIEEAAKAAGLKEVYFADLETLSILGIWTQRWIHVYGK